MIQPTELGILESPEEDADANDVDELFDVLVAAEDKPPTR